MWDPSRWKTTWLLPTPERDASGLRSIWPAKESWRKVQSASQPAAPRQMCPEVPTSPLVRAKNSSAPLAPALAGLSTIEGCSSSSDGLMVICCLTIGSMQSPAPMVLLWNSFRGANSPPGPTCSVQTAHHWSVNATRSPAEKTAPPRALVEMRWTLTRPPVWGRLATQTPLEDWYSRKVELPSSAAASTRPRRGLWALVQVLPLPSKEKIRPTSAHPPPWKDTNPRVSPPEVTTASAVTSAKSQPTWTTVVGPPAALAGAVSAPTTRAMDRMVRRASSHSHHLPRVADRGAFWQCRQGGLVSPRTTTVPFRSLTTAVTFWTASPMVMVQPMLAPISTTRTLGAPGAPQRTVAARAVGWSSRRIRLTMWVTSMIGLAGSRAKRPPVPAASTSRRVTE
jgi:hypothetical protein